MKGREDFYKAVVLELIPDKTSSILVCGGGDLDKRVLESIGFTDVTISNLDERVGGADFAPYKWLYENAESLTCKNGSFEFVIIHAAIHHAFSPHRVLTEMYRVAKIGILAFEARDSVLMRIFERLRIVQTYEHAAVYYNSSKYGGVNNSEIPNYVYRWTEREVEKTIRSYAPYAPHAFTYRYGTAFPCTPELENEGRLKYILLKCAQPFFALFARLFPRQQNLFAFYVSKPSIPEMLFPWLKQNDEGSIRFNREWGERKYKNADLVALPNVTSGAKN